MIVGARLKAAAVQAVMIGWHAEAFARTKQVKPLGEYLKPAKPAAAQRAEGAADVLALFKRLHERQAQNGG